MEERNERIRFRKTRDKGKEEVAKGVVRFSTAVPAKVAEISEELEQEEKQSR